MRGGDREADTRWGGFKLGDVGIERLTLGGVGVNAVAAEGTWCRG